MSFERARALALAAALGFAVLGCEDEPAVKPSPHAFAVSPDIVTGVSIRGSARRLEVSRGGAKGPFTYRYSDGQGGAARSCPENPRLAAALARVMTIPSFEAVSDEDAARALAGVPAGDWVDLEVRDTIENVEPLQLRLLPPTAQRPKAYAQVPNGPYFVTDGKLLEVLGMDCESGGTAR